jgi:hypothetical protein
VTSAERFGCSLALLFDQAMNLFAQDALGDTNETPRLHQPDAGRAVSSIQQSLHGGGIDRIGFEMAHVTPLGNGAIDGGALGIAEAMDGLSHVYGICGEEVPRILSLAVRKVIE